MISTDTTVNCLVTERPGRARVFEVLGIDYCCGGNRPLGEVCVEKGLDAPTVLRMLEAFDLGGGTEERTDWSKATMAELVDHIVEVHHGYLREALPRLEFLVDKVASAHGDRHPELLRLREVFDSLRPDLEAHLREEEEVLFPMCRQLEGADISPDLRDRAVSEPTRAMLREHEDVGKVLARIRELAADFEPPADACNTYRAMFDGLAEFEADLHLHIHEENNILFSKAAEAALSVER